MHAEVVRLSVDAGVGTITLNRPDALNALNFAAKDELAAALREAGARADVRCVLLTGAGRAFCAGGDVSEWEPEAPPEATRRRMTKLADDVVLPLARFEKPVVAAVNGHAHGLGFALALACDIIYAAESALVSMAFVKMGLGPDGAASYLLPRLVGLSRAKELMFTGRRLSAGEAHELGLVTRVVPDAELMPAAGAFAAELAAGPTVALSAVKRLLNDSGRHSIEEVVQLEAYSQAIAMSTHDHLEGIAAFREKRGPRFAGH